jgi:hypothetical protein
MLDGAILSGRIHGLENQEQGIFVLGIQLILQRRHFSDIGRKKLLRILFRMQLAGISGSPITELEPASFFNAIFFDIHELPPGIADFVTKAFFMSTGESFDYIFLRSLEPLLKGTERGLCSKMDLFSRQGENLFEFPEWLKRAGGISNTCRFP